MYKTPEELAYNKACGALRAFLEGRQELNWLLGDINFSGVKGNPLAEIFESLRGQGDKQRYEKAEFACRQRGWLP